MRDEIEQYDSINELVLAGEFGFNRLEGPWSVEKEGTKWTVVFPYERAGRAPDRRDEGHAAVLIADGKAVGGGVVETVFDPQDEGETHVVVDQYAMQEIQHESEIGTNASEWCDNCGDKVVLTEANVESRVTDDRYDRYMCPCGQTTVQDFDQSRQTDDTQENR